MRNLAILHTFIYALLGMCQAKQCYDKNLKVSCEVRNKNFSTIYFLQLSKDQQDIVLIQPIFDPQTKTDFTVKWQNTSIQGRASTNKSVIYPWNEAQLVMEIQKDDIDKGDIGQYDCHIKGLNISNQVEEDSYPIHKQVTSVSCPLSNGVTDSDSASHSLTLLTVIFLDIVINYI